MRKKKSSTEGVLTGNERELLVWIINLRDRNLTNSERVMLHRIRTKFALVGMINNDVAMMKTASDRGIL